MEKKITVRIPIEYYDKMSKILSKEIGNKSKNTWILEAIHEKLSKNRKKGTK